MTQDASNTIEVETVGGGAPAHVHRMPPANMRPTFHVSREMVCFGLGIAVALGVMWVCVQMSGKRKKE